jgi:hypothetical protein
MAGRDSGYWFELGRCSDHIGTRRAPDSHNPRFPSWLIDQPPHQIKKLLLYVLFEQDFLYRPFYPRYRQRALKGSLAAHCIHISLIGRVCPELEAIHTKYSFRRVPAKMYE